MINNQGDLKLDNWELIIGNRHTTSSDIPLLIQAKQRLMCGRPQVCYSIFVAIINTISLNVFTDQLTVRLEDNSSVLL